MGLSYLFRVIPGFFGQLLIIGIYKDDSKVITYVILFSFIALAFVSLIALMRYSNIDVKKEYR